MDNKFGITDPKVLAAAADGVAAMRYRGIRDEQPPQVLDLDHLNRLHERLYGDVFPDAGRLREGDLVTTANGDLDVRRDGGPGHETLAAHMRGLDLQRERDGERLRNAKGPDWGDIAGYHVAELHLARPYRAGNELTLRLYTEQLAKASGQTLTLGRAEEQLGKGAFEEALENAKHRSYDSMRVVMARAVSPRVVSREVSPVEQLDFTDRLQKAELAMLASPQAKERLGGDGYLDEVATAITSARQHLPRAYDDAVRAYQKRGLEGLRAQLDREQRDDREPRRAAPDPYHRH